MNKIVPIFLIFVLLFNVLGYYGLFMGLRLKTSHDLTQRLDANAYNAEETFTLKIPMAVPYHNDEDQYKRVQGEIEHNGEFFQLVKQKLSNDTLYVVCFKDSKSGDINKLVKDHVKTFSDKPVDTKHQSKFFSGFIKDYLPTSIALSSSIDGWNQTISYTLTTDLLQGLCLSVLSPPPEA